MPESVFCDFVFRRNLLPWLRYLTDQYSILEIPIPCPVQDFRQICLHITAEGTIIEVLLNQRQIVTNAMPCHVSKSNIVKLTYHIQPAIGNALS